MPSLFEQILAARGIKPKNSAAFLNPEYSSSHDPFLLPDMAAAITRLKVAKKNKEKIVIYGDYDIDGLTATTLLMGAFSSFGFRDVCPYIPNRFSDGYGLSIESIKKVAKMGADLIITVDCGSLSHKEIEIAKKMGMDVIVTDHHEVSETQPPAVAVINPKRSDSKYPFRDLASVGVAYKLVQAMQKEFRGLPEGQEKWLLDLVALGTVCDVVKLADENRMLVYWGLKVMSKTRRPGLRALMAVSGVDTKNVNSRSLGFGLGPRLNAAGRLETAQHALELLITDDTKTAIEKARQLDELNKERRIEQDRIYEQAVVLAEKFIDDPVLVLSGEDWNHGIVGIVAAKILEKYKKPTFILQEMGEDSKGSARSFGDFCAVDVVRAGRDIITKGGGHKFAAGVTLPTKRIDDFRKHVNKYYKDANIVDQERYLLPIEDAVSTFDQIDRELVEAINRLEPFGLGNEKPVLRSVDLTVINVRRMGDRGQHLKLSMRDVLNRGMIFVAFNAPEYFFVENGAIVDAWFCPEINTWQGLSNVEGKLVHILIKK